MQLSLQINFTIPQKDVSHFGSIWGQTGLGLLGNTKWDSRCPVWY